MDVCVAVSVGVDVREGEMELLAVSLRETDTVAATEGETEGETDTVAKAEGETDTVAKAEGETVTVAKAEGEVDAEREDVTLGDTGTQAPAAHVRPSPQSKSSAERRPSGPVVQPNLSAVGSQILQASGSISPYK